MGDWSQLKLSDCCSPTNNSEIVDPEKVYKMAGVQLWGKGAYERERISGFSTQYKSFSKLEVNNLVLNKIWARNGAVTVVHDELGGAFVSPEFPVYRIDQSKVLPDWLRLITMSEFFWEACTEKSYGTSGKNRIKPEKFLEIEIPTPPLNEQMDIVSKLKTIEEKMSKLDQLRKKQAIDISNFLYSKYIDIASNCPTKKMSEIAPITRRPVEVEVSRNYQEIAARSFGKGTFVKPSFKGIDLTWQKPYWVKGGDLLFSNIKAWEGAIALVDFAHEDWVVSHRYITCVPDVSEVLPNYLLYYLLSPFGLEQVNLASPGSADRNRTLSLRKLDKIEVPIPSLDKQREFELLLDKTSQMKAHIQASQKELDELFPALLDRAFKGELV